jgi:hypothetical protein
MVQVTDTLLDQLGAQPTISQEIGSSTDIDLPVNFDAHADEFLKEKVSGANAKKILISEEEAATTCVAFSCGHHTSESELGNKWLPDLESTLADLFPSLTVTSLALLNAYKSISTGKVVHLACPSCVICSMSNHFPVTKSFLA